MKLYHDTEKELFFDDYMPLPSFKGETVPGLSELLDNLQDAAGNAFVNGSALLENALYDDIITVKRQLLSMIVSSYSSGTIAGIIGSNKYLLIDRAVNKTLMFSYHAEPEQLYGTGTDSESIAQLIVNCYRNKDL